MFFLTIANVLISSSLGEADNDVNQALDPRS